MKSIKKVALTWCILALVLTLLCPVFAAADDGSITITITPDRAVSNTSDPHRFVAYQIISGTVANTDAISGVSGITWGTGIDGAALKEAVIADAQFTDAIAYLGQIIFETEDMRGDYSALIAACLHDYPYLAQPLTSIAKNYLLEPYTTTEWNEEMENWQFTLGQPGFYYIEDTFVEPEEGDKDDRAVSNIIEITRDMELNLIIAFPDVSRKVDFMDSTVADMGTPFTFDVTALMPLDIDDYTIFPLDVNEHVDDGIIVDVGSITVKLDGKLLQEGVDIYSVVTKANDDGSTDISIQFPDVKGVEMPEVTRKSSIDITYNAILAADVKPGKAYDSYSQLAYSLDGVSMDKAVSVRRHTRVCTMAMDITADAGSQYVIQNIEGKYGKLKKVDDTTWRVESWQSEQKSATVITQPSDTSIRITGISCSNYYIQDIAAPSGMAPNPDIMLSLSGYLDENGQMTELAAAVPELLGEDLSHYAQAAVANNAFGITISHDASEAAAAENSAENAETQENTSKPSAVTSSGSGTMIGIVLIVTTLIAALVVRFVTKKK